MKIDKLAGGFNPFLFRGVLSVYNAKADDVVKNRFNPFLFRGVLSVKQLQLKK